VSVDSANRAHHHSVHYRRVVHHLLPRLSVSHVALRTSKLVQQSNWICDAMRWPTLSVCDSAQRSYIVGPLRGCCPLKFLHALQPPKLYFKLDLGHRAASS